MEQYKLPVKDGSWLIEYCGYTIDNYYVFQFVEGKELYYVSQTRLKTLERVN